MNYLGLDWGKAKIGLAIGSDEVKIASPILILRSTGGQDLIFKLREIIEQENIEAIVVGKPVSLSGQMGESAEFDNFVAGLESLGVRVEVEDERLSTKMAQKLQRGAEKKGDDDALAAAIILQSYFDRL